MAFSDKKKLLIFISVITLCLTLSITNQSTIASMTQVSNLRVSLTDSFPILINSNDSFEILGFSGNGSSSSPYIIENLRILATNPLGVAIIVGNTDVYFVIQNCEIVSDYIGIFVQPTVATGTAKIINNTLTCSSKSGGGISVGSDQTLIENNTISGFMQGIHINEADDMIIKGNAILLSHYQGINIRYSSFNTITDNEIRNSKQHGLAIVGDSCIYNIIYNNLFVNNSNTPTYEIDNVITGETNSQGYDGGSNNQWFDSMQQIGNMWSDYDGKEAYKIDGDAGSSDLYPLKYDTYTSESNYTSIIGLVAFISLVSFIAQRRK